MARFLRIACVLALCSISATATAVEPAPQWIVVTAPDYKEALEPLRQQRVAQGYDVTLLTSADLFALSDTNLQKAGKLRDRLHTLTAKTTGKSYVLLIGAVVAPGPDRPSRELPTFFGAIGRMRNVPTDNPFGCPLPAKSPATTSPSTRPADPIAADFLPTVPVGRLPARSPAEAKAMIDKILTFENTGNQAAWRRSLALLVGNPGGTSAAERTLGNWYINNACQSTVDQLPPLWNVRALYHVPSSPWYVDDDALHDASLKLLEQGQTFSFYLGHSSPAGFWSNSAPFLDRADWTRLNIPGHGIFMTCGCFTAQLDPQGRDAFEGYGLSAIRNPAGPVAVIGASGETYAAMGQLAFNGLLQDLKADALPPHLGDLWLHIKQGIASGPLDYFTFTMFDYGDGSSGKVPQATQRLEHLEMWTLLGDPALKLPLIAPEFTLDAPVSAAPGATITVRATLPPGVAAKQVHLTLERPMGGIPNNQLPLPEAPGKDRTATLAANFQKANNPILTEVTLPLTSNTFETTLTLPKTLPWPRLTLRATTPTATALTNIKINP